MKNTLIALILICANQISFSQDLHIYYDVSKDSISFLKNKIPVNRSNLKKGEKAILHVINYNDYIYDVRIKTAGQNYSIPSSGAGKIFSFGGGQDAFNQLKDAAGSFGITGFQLSENSLTNDRSGAVDAESGAPKEAIALSKQFQSTLKSMEKIEDNLIEIAEGIGEDLQKQQQIAFKKGEIKDIRTNPNLSPQKIKDISLQYMKDILLMEEEDDVFDLETLIDKSDPQQVIGSQIKDYKDEVLKLEAKFTELKTINDFLSTYQIPPTDAAIFLSSYMEAEKRYKKYEENIEVLEQQIQELSKLSLKELVDVRYMYEEMKEHKFEKKIIFSPEDDLTQINISLVPVDSVQIQGLKTKSLTPLQLEVFGGLKINASVGISFAAFFDRPQLYTVREARIIADDLDPFTPIVTSFIHFHPQSRSQVSLGGAFGLGIGIGGENSGLQTYFLGPSLILGKQQRIVFTTGLMGGKVDRLAQGYSIGDSYDESILPTKSVYELGYFLGISFNFLGN